MRHSRVVKSYDELRADMAEARVHPSDADYAIAELERHEATVQSDYDKRPPSTGYAANLHRVRNAPEGKPQIGIRGSVVKDSDDATDDGSRTYSGSSGQSIKWADMSLPHLQNAARKSGDPEMLAYAAKRAGKV